MTPHTVLAAAVALTALTAATAAPGAPSANLTESSPVTFQVPGPLVEQKAERALSTAIAAFQAGAPDYETMESGVVDNVKAHKDALIAALKTLGDLRSLEYAGYAPQGWWRYKGQFASGSAELVIGFGPNGKIQTLWLKPGGT